MKKIVYALVLLLGVSVAGCIKDSPNPTPTPTGLAQKILGKWKMDKQVTETNGQPPITTTFTNDFREFQTGGKMILTTYNPQTNQTITNEGTYTIKNESTINFGDVDRTVTTIDDHTLIFYNYFNATTKLTFYYSK